MPVAHKGAIAFGLVYIPVDIYTATQDEDIRFNQLAKDNDGVLKRVQYKKTCPNCKDELAASDIVKGFQYEKNKYVVVTDEDFAKIKTEKDSNIQILQFVDPESIPPVYYEKSYQTLPHKGGEKPYELLRQAMLNENKVAIGKTVIGTKETLLALIPGKDMIMMEALFFEAEIKSVPKLPAKPKISDGELKMAEQLVDSMSGKFVPEDFKDEYQERLRDLIQKKIEGREIVQQKSEEPANIINLMDALKASLEQSKPQKKAPRKKAS